MNSSISLPFASNNGTLERFRRREDPGEMVTFKSLEGNTANSGESASRTVSKLLGSSAVNLSRSSLSSWFVSKSEFGMRRYRPGSNVRSHASTPFEPLSHGSFLTISRPIEIRRPAPTSASAQINGSFTNHIIPNYKNCYKLKYLKNLIDFYVDFQTNKYQNKAMQLIQLLMANRHRTKMGLESYSN